MFLIKLGNEIAGKECHIKWIFTAQEDGRELEKGTEGGNNIVTTQGKDSSHVSQYGEKAKNIVTGTIDSQGKVSGNVKTGDNSEIWRYLVTMIGSAGMIVLIFIWRRKEKRIKVK